MAQKTFSNQDVANYYDHTAPHYRQFWRLDKSMALHYGFWKPGTKTFKESLENTNAELATLAQIDASDHVLDAGCGVGGSAIFLAKKVGCQATGITLSHRQVSQAFENAKSENVAHLTHFEERDYTNTGFPDSSFDVVWALESVGTCHEKTAFIKEAHRILKTGGRLVVADYFKRNVLHQEESRLLNKWLHGWAIADITTIDDFCGAIENGSFWIEQNKDVSSWVERSARRLYRASVAGVFGTWFYNLFHNATPFSKTHATAGIAQYKAFKRQLWKYHLVLAVKAEK